MARDRGSEQNDGFTDTILMAPVFQVKTMHSIQDHKREAACHSMPYRDFTGSVLFLAVLSGENRTQESSQHVITFRMANSEQEFHR